MEMIKIEIENPVQGQCSYCKIDKEIILNIENPFDSVNNYQARLLFCERCTWRFMDDYEIAARLKLDRIEKARKENKK